jgi:hypothetical protein
MRLAWGGHALLGVGAAILAAGKCSAMLFAATPVVQVHVFTPHFSFRSIHMSQGVDEEFTVPLARCLFWAFLRPVWARPSGSTPGERHQLKVECEEQPSQSALPVLVSLRTHWKKEIAKRKLEYLEDHEIILNVVVYSERACLWAGRCDTSVVQRAYQQLLKGLENCQSLLVARS